MTDLTIIYYTSNREDEQFELNVQRQLYRSAKHLPIVSVSQKPIDFGTNICVGDIGASAENIVIQMLAGANAADTEYISFGESDCLYPPDYFNFKPKRNDIFYYTGNFYVLWNHRNSFYRKRRAELSSVVNRKHFIEVSKSLLSSEYKHISNQMKRLTKQEWFESNPVISIKTRNGLHWATPHDRKSKTYKIPYWGTAEEIKRMIYV